MKLLTTYETVGILGSIAVMALGLSVSANGMPNFFSSTDAPVTEEQTAVVTLSEEEVKNEHLKTRLEDAYSVTGELVKLVVEDTQEGDGDAVVVGDTLVVHYVGSLLDGTQIDSSYDRNQTFVFTIGNGTVIEGWEEGLIGMRVGGKRVLIIPSSMAYGNRQVGTIAPNTPLMYAIELIEIR